MSLSRAESALVALAGKYDQALEALLREDLHRVEALLGEADELLGDLPRPEDDSEVEKALRAKACERYGCLVGAVHSARDEVRDRIKGAREARKALRAFGGRAPTKGTRIARDA